MSSLGLDRSAAMALGIAATAMPFAGSREEEAERWLRILRTHGDASLLLSSVGVTEAAGEELVQRREGERDPGPARGAGPDEHDAIARVSEAARAHASRRGAEAVTTCDILGGVMEVYGESFHRVLRSHGTSHDEVLELLERQPDGSGGDGR